MASLSRKQVQVGKLYNRPKSGKGEVSMTSALMELEIDGVDCPNGVNKTMPKKPTELPQCVVHELKDELSTRCSANVLLCYFPPIGLKESWGHLDHLLGAKFLISSKVCEMELF